MSTSLTPSKRPNDRSFKEPNSKGKRKNKKPQKIPPGSTIVKLLCPASKAGNIIGKGGSVISQIREETGAKVRVEETVPGCDERVVTIVGCDGELGDASDHTPEVNSNKGDANKEGESAEEQGKSNEDIENSKSKKGPSSLLKALLRVFEKLIEEENETDKGEENSNKSPPIVLRLLVISSQVGCILGKGGNVIKQISTDSGAQIRILPRDKVPLCVSPSDELVQITGEMDAVKKAISLISQQLLENPLRDPGTYLANHAGPSSNSRGQLFAARGAAFGSGPHDVVSGGALAPSLIPRFNEGGIPVGVKPPHEMLSFRLLCHHERVGTIIGKGGMVVKTLQQETGCEINVIEGASESEDRIIVITGPAHPDDRISAVQDAVLRVQNRIVRAVPDNQESPAVARILVSSNQIGCLLGKGGSIIAEMRKSSGAFIRIMGKDQIPKCASENEEVVQINGDLETVQEALLQITHRLRHHFFYGSTPMDRVPNPALLDPFPSLPPFMRREFSPSGIFSNFGPPHHKFDAVGAPPGAFYPHDDRPPFMNSVFRPGVRPLMPDRHHWGPEGLNESGGPLGFSDFGGAAAPRRTGFGGGNQPAIITSTTIEVVVPRSVVPAIYGEDGGCLRQIRQISDAKITITDPKPGDTETIIIISGTPEQTHAAQSLIQAFVLSETETI